ncbi:hypothetical protein QFZ70_002067 [Arthrobacter sp. V1I9]|nr:hypothetical protein [Arthrobacter sp. V1I9]
MTPSMVPGSRRHVRPQLPHVLQLGQVARKARDAVAGFFSRGFDPCLVRPDGEYPMPGPTEGPGDSDA